jgi:hypothetical protein
MHVLIRFKEDMRTHTPWKCCKKKTHTYSSETHTYVNSQRMPGLEHNASNAASHAADALHDSRAQGLADVNPHQADGTAKATCTVAGKPCILAGKPVYWRKALLAVIVWRDIEPFSVYQDKAAIWLLFWAIFGLRMWHMYHSCWNEHLCASNFHVRTHGCVCACMYKRKGGKGKGGRGLHKSEALVYHTCSLTCASWCGADCVQSLCVCVCASVCWHYSWYFVILYGAWMCCPCIYMCNYVRVCVYVCVHAFTWMWMCACTMSKHLYCCYVSLMFVFVCLRRNHEYTTIGKGV